MHESLEGRKVEQGPGGAATTRERETERQGVSPHGSSDVGTRTEDTCRATYGYGSPDLTWGDVPGTEVVVDGVGVPGQETMVAYGTGTRTRDTALGHTVTSVDITVTVGRVEQDES